MCMRDVNSFPHSGGEELVLAFVVFLKFFHLLA
jgi:hypothetical protein